VRAFHFSAAAFLLVAGCKPRYVAAGHDGVVIRSSKIGLYTKEVIAKQAPDTLIAGDGTTCRVSPDVYKGSAEHGLVYCSWQ
jgi:hypothetical protein